MQCIRANKSRTILTDLLKDQFVEKKNDYHWCTSRRITSISVLYCGSTFHNSYFCLFFPTQLFLKCHFWLMRFARCMRVPVSDTRCQCQHLIFRAQRALFFLVHTPAILNCTEFARCEINIVDEWSSCSSTAVWSVRLC